MSEAAEIRLPTVAALEGARCVFVGGAGFIGSSLARVLLLAGADVLVYDNLATGGTANLESCAAEAGRMPGFLHGDVRDAEKLARTLPARVSSSTSPASACATRSTRPARTMR